MRVLVVGNGGREDALCKKLQESPLCEKLYCCPGNAGTARYAENLSLGNDEEIVNFAKEHVVKQSYLLEKYLDLENVIKLNT